MTSAPPLSAMMLLRSRNCSKLATSIPPPALPLTVLSLSVTAPEIPPP
jgi:hypothetical protein